MATNLRVGVSIGAVLGSGFRSAFGNARSTVDRLGRTADTLGRRHQRLGQMMARAMAHPTRNVGALRRQYEQLGRTLERVKAKQEALAASQARGQALASARGEVRGQMLETAGHGIAMAAPVVASVRTAIGFEAAMSKVKALSGASAEQMDMLRGQAKELGRTTSFSASDVAAGQSFLSMAGFTPESVKAAMPGMLDLAAAGGIDLATTADVSSNIMSGFSLAAGESGRVSDVLAKTFTTTNTNLTQLGEAMKYAAPGADNLNVSLEETAAMVGLLGNVGIQGSEAGTALRAGLLRLAAPPKAAADALAELGIQTKDAQGNMRAMPELLKEIAEKTKGMGSGDRMGWLADVFGVEASSAFSVLLDQAEGGQLQEKIAELENSAGTSKRIATEMNDNAQGALKAMSSALEGAAISIGDVFLPAVGEIAGYIGSAATAVSNFAEAHPSVVKWVVMAGAAMLGLKVGFLAVKYGALMVMGQLNGLQTAYHLVTGKTLMLKAASQGGLFTRLAGRFRVLGRVLRGGVVRGATLAGRAVLFLGRALLMNPIGLAVTAIAAGAYLIYRHWDTLGPWFRNLWGGIKSVFAGAVAGIRSVWSGITGWFGGLWQELKDGVSGGLGGIGRLIVNFSPLGLFYRAFSGVMSWFGVDLPGRFSEFGGNLISGLINGVKNKLAAAKEAIVGFGANVKGWFASTLGIKSPSRVFAGFGDNISQGVAMGLGRSQGVAAGSAAALALATTTAFGQPQLPVPELTDAGAPPAQQGRLAERAALVQRLTAAQGQPVASAGQGGQGATITFAPTITVTGVQGAAAVREQVTEATRLSFVEFERMMRRYESEQRRRRYGDI